MPTTPDLSKLTALIASINAKALVAKPPSALKPKPTPTKSVESFLIPRHWRTVALVAIFDEWECTCGEKGRSPQGFFYEQELADKANCSRLLAAPATAVTEPLPHRSRFCPRIVPVCETCWVSASPGKTPTATPGTFGAFTAEWVARRAAPSATSTTNERITS